MANKDEVKRVDCRYCERAGIAVNNLTGGLRIHKVPDDYPYGDGLIMVPGEECPGTGSRPGDPGWERI